MTYTELTDKTIVAGTKQETKVAGRGDLVIKVSVDGKPFNIRMMDVLHVPGLGTNFSPSPKLSSEVSVFSSLTAVFALCLAAV